MNLEDAKIQRWIKIFSPRPKFKKIARWNYNRKKLQKRILVVSNIKEEVRLKFALRMMYNKGTE